MSEDLPSACGQFTAEGEPKAGEPVLYQFSSVVAPSRTHAESYFEGVVEGLDDGTFRKVQSRHHFGDEDVKFTADLGEGVDIGIVVFRIDEQVATWGTAGQGIKPFETLHDLFVDVGAGASLADDDYSRVMSLLPSLDDLPPGFSVTAEERAPRLDAPVTVVKSPVGSVASNEDATVSDLEATIAALEKQLEEQESDSEAETQTPESTETPTATQAASKSVVGKSTQHYPDVVLEFVEEDSSTGCDRIGWNGMTNTNTDQNRFYAACTDDGIVYYMGCGYMTAARANAILGPAPANMWVLCIVQVANASDSSVNINVLDFALVEADNRRHDVSFTPLAMSPESMLSIGALPAGQMIEGTVAFETPRNMREPARVEISPQLFSKAEPGIIILDPLEPVP